MNQSFQTSPSAITQTNSAKPSNSQAPSQSRSAPKVNSTSLNSLFRKNLESKPKPPQQLEQFQSNVENNKQLPPNSQEKLQVQNNLEPVREEFSGQQNDSSAVVGEIKANEVQPVDISFQNSTIQEEKQVNKPEKMNSRVRQEQKPPFQIDDKELFSSSEQFRVPPPHNFSPNTSTQEQHQPVDQNLARQSQQINMNDQMLANDQSLQQKLAPQIDTQPFLDLSTRSCQQIHHASPPSLSVQPMPQIASSSQQIPQNTFAQEQDTQFQLPNAQINNFPQFQSFPQMPTPSFGNSYAQIQIEQWKLENVSVPHILNFAAPGGFNLSQTQDINSSFDFDEFKKKQGPSSQVPQFSNQNHSQQIISFQEPFFQPPAQQMTLPRVFKPYRLSHDLIIQFTEDNSFQNSKSKVKFLSRVLKHSVISLIPNQQIQQFDFIFFALGYQLFLSTIINPNGNTQQMLGLSIQEQIFLQQQKLDQEYKELLKCIKSQKLQMPEKLQFLTRKVFYNKTFVGLMIAIAKMVILKSIGNLLSINVKNPNQVEAPRSNILNQLCHSIQGNAFEVWNDQGKEFINVCQSQLQMNLIIASENVQANDVILIKPQIKDHSKETMIVFFGSQEQQVLFGKSTSLKLLEASISEIDTTNYSIPFKKLAQIFQVINASKSKEEKNSDQEVEKEKTQKIEKLEDQIMEFVYSEKGFLKRSDEYLNKFLTKQIPHDNYFSLSNYFRGHKDRILSMKQQLLFLNGGNISENVIKALTEMLAKNSEFEVKAEAAFCKFSNELKTAKSEEELKGNSNSGLFQSEPR